MNLKIDCKNISIKHGTYCDNIEVEIINEECYPEQLEHYVDYLNEKYGTEFLNAIKKRFDLQEVE